MDIDRLVGGYVACRDSLNELSAEFKKVEKEHKDQMKIMEKALMDAADAQGVESFKTSYGTAYKSKKDWVRAKPKVDGEPGWEEALEFMIKNNLTHLLTKSVGKAAAKEYMDEHGGALPPGLEYGFEPTILIRRK